MIPSCIAWLEKRCSGIPLFVSLYSRPYQQVLKNEIELASIEREDLVLNIGCGSIPFTSIYVHYLTGAEIVAMDYDREAIERARLSLKRMGLDDKISLYQGDASCEIPVDFTVALVALQARPKEEIFKQLKERGEPASRLIFRQPREEYGRFYDTLPSTYKPQDVAWQDMKTFDRSLLFTE